MDVNTSSTVNRKKYNDAVSGPESKGSYTIINKKKTKIIDGKKVTVEKPVEQWAIGRYQHYYKYHEDKIVSALKSQGISTSGLSKKDIATAYSNSPKAQEIVQNKLNDTNFKAAEKQIAKHGLKAPIEEIAFLNHFLGVGGANRYLGYLKKYGQDKADQMMAYGDGADFKGIGGPKSSVANALVSQHMLNFRGGSTATASTTKPTTTKPVVTKPVVTKPAVTKTTPPKPVAPKENKVVTKEAQKNFDNIVASYKGVQQGKLNGIDEMQYNPMGWGADKGVKRKGQNWRNHDNHIHFTFTDPQVAIAIIKKSQELGLNPNENLYVGEVHDVHKKHPVTGAKESLHYFNFDGEFDGKKLSKGLDVNFKNTGLTAKEGHAKMAQLYKWIHQTYSM